MGSIILMGGLSGSTPAGLFTPGVQGVWFDPSEFSTMYQDTAGTTPVTATGQSVALILDKSGNGNHATQATALDRPTLQQDAGGHYYLSFNGTTMFVQFSGASQGLASGSLSVCAGVYQTALNTGARLLTNAADNAAIVTYWDAVDGQEKSTVVYTNSTSTTLLSPTVDSINTAYVRSDIYDRTGLALTNYRNTVQQGTIATSNIDMTLPATSTMGGGPVGFYYAGRIYQFIEYAFALTTAQRGLVEIYVNGKTGAY